MQAHGRQQPRSPDRSQPRGQPRNHVIEKFVDRAHRDAVLKPDIGLRGDVRGPWYSLKHQFVMEAGDSKLPRAPITGKAQGERPKIPHLA